MQMKNVKYKYPGQNNDVLKGVSSEFPEGKVTALLGANGSGKTTLFKILLKVLDSYEGSVYVDGRETKDLSRSELSEFIAWVPQEEESLFPYTVGEYLLLGRAPHLGFFSLPTKEDEKMIIRILNELGISHISRRNTMSLSGGEKRLVFIARALVQEPQILILDEPTAHLDIGNKARALGVIRAAANSGKTVIFSTHDPNEASLVADNVEILHGGEIVKRGNPSQVLTEDILSKVYGVDVVVREIDNKPVVELAPNNFKVGK